MRGGNLHIATYSLSSAGGGVGLTFILLLLGWSGVSFFDGIRSLFLSDSVGMFIFRIISISLDSRSVSHHHQARGCGLNRKPHCRTRWQGSFH